MKERMDFNIVIVTPESGTEFINQSNKKTLFMRENQW